MIRQTENHRNGRPRRNRRPFWNPSLRELWLGNRLVKRFTKPAEFQTRILDVFQEEGWPPVIDDPLPPGKLHNAVAGLQARQLEARIRFYRTGMKTQIRWEIAEEEAA